MGKFEFKLPDIGEGVVEGEIVEWMVAVGDTVKEDDPILSVMTDKATVEIPAPCDGTVSSIVGEAGDIIPVGGVCIVFDVEGDGNASEAAEPVEEEAPAVEETPAPVVEAKKPEPATSTSNSLLVPDPRDGSATLTSTATSLAGRRLLRQPCPWVVRPRSCETAPRTSRSSVCAEKLPTA